MGRLERSPKTVHLPSVKIVPIFLRIKINDRRRKNIDTYFRLQ